MQQLKKKTNLKMKYFLNRFGNTAFALGKYVKRSTSKEIFNVGKK